MKRIGKMGNKGYMLIEIILASSIAFALAYFMIELTIKLKNKNDDLLVETLTATDSSIISNGIMRYIKVGYETDENFEFNCEKLKYNKDSRKFMINGKTIDKVNKYAVVGTISCPSDVPDGTIHISVPLSVEQLNKNFNVDLYYRIGE